MLIFTALLGKDRSRDAAARGLLAESAKALPPLGAVEVEEFRGENLYVGMVRPPAADVAPREYVFDADGIVTFFDGLIVDGTDVVVAADRVAAKWRSLPERVEGNFVAARADLARGELELFVDPFGLKQVFVVRDGETWLISNSQHVVLPLLRQPRFDATALPMFLAMQGTGHGNSIVAGMRRLPGGSRLTWSGDTGREVSAPYYDRSTLTALPKRPLTEKAVRRTTDWICESLSSLSKTFGEMRGPITGGRDSRVLAAAVSRTGIPCGFFTGAKEGSAEARTATAVAKAIGAPHEITSPRPAEVEKNWDRALELFLLQTDGNASLWQLPNVLNTPTERRKRPIVLGGHGGELGRTPFGIGWDLLSRSGRFPLDELPLRMCDSYEGLLREECCRFARDYVRDRVRDLLRITRRWENIVDAIAYFERQCTRDGAAIRIGHSHRDMYTPLYSRVFAEAAWRLSASDRYFERFHSEIIRAAAPRLVEIPYDTRPRRWQRPVYDLIAFVGRHFDLQRLRRRKQQASSRLNWTFTMLPQLRALCLDQGSSQIWEHVNRDLFDRVTRVSEGSDFEPLFGDGILKVATVFLLADRYGIR